MNAIASVKLKVNFVNVREIKEENIYRFLRCCTLHDLDNDISLPSNAHHGEPYVFYIFFPAKKTCSIDDDNSYDKLIVLRFVKGWKNFIKKNILKK